MCNNALLPTQAVCQLQKGEIGQTLEYWLTCSVGFLPSSHIPWQKAWWITLAWLQLSFTQVEHLTSRLLADIKKVEVMFVSWRNIFNICIQLKMTICNVYVSGPRHLSMMNKATQCNGIKFELESNYVASLALKTLFVFVQHSDENVYFLKKCPNVCILICRCLFVCVFKVAVYSCDMCWNCTDEPVTPTQTPSASDGLFSTRSLGRFAFDNSIKASFSLWRFYDILSQTPASLVLIQRDKREIWKWRKSGGLGVSTSAGEPRK